MERTLILIKPSAIQRSLIGEVLSRFEKKGLKLCGIKMIRLSNELLAEHYAHILSNPVYPLVRESMQKTPVIACCVEGVEAIRVVRGLTGVTNGRNAAPGTIRGDYAVSILENIVHTSDSPESAEGEIKRFFCKEELFDYTSTVQGFLYGNNEL